MYRQVGNLKLDSRGIAYRGLLVRHLVLPEGIAQTQEVLAFLKSVDENLAINIMGQYYPAYKAFDYPELNRRIRSQEYAQALRLVDGLTLVTD